MSPNRQKTASQRVLCVPKCEVAIPRPHSSRPLFIGRTSSAFGRPTPIQPFLNPDMDGINRHATTSQPSGEDVAKMGDFPAIFAMANPDPEIAPEEVAKALEGRKYVMVTGRSDYPNQVNNVLGFPYLFRGALDVGATTINMPMKVAAANALAALARLPVPEDVKTLYPDETLEFGTGYIIPKPFDRRLFVEVPFAVAEAAVKSGVTRAGIDFAAYRLNLERRNAARQSA